MKLKPLCTASFGFGWTKFWFLRIGEDKSKGARLTWLRLPESGNHDNVGNANCQILIEKVPKWNDVFMEVAAQNITRALLRKGGSLLHSTNDTICLKKYTQPMAEYTTENCVSQKTLLLCIVRADSWRCLLVRLSFCYASHFSPLTPRLKVGFTLYSQESRNPGFVY